MNYETYTLEIAALYLVLFEIENTLHTACIKSAKPCVIDFSFDYGKIGLLRTVANISFYLRQEQSGRLTFLSFSKPLKHIKPNRRFAEIKRRKNFVKRRSVFP